MLSLQLLVVQCALLLNVVGALEVEGGVLGTVGLNVAALHGLNCVSN